MSKSLEFYSSLLDENKLSEIINYSLHYPKTSDEKDENGGIAMAFNANSLDKILPKIKDNIELKYHKITDDIMFLLNLINKFRHEVLLKEADYLIIKKNNFTLLKLENEGKPNSGRSIKIDINSFRTMIEVSSNEVFKKRFNFGVIIAASLFLTWRFYG